MRSRKPRARLSLAFATGDLAREWPAERSLLDRETVIGQNSVSGRSGPPDPAGRLRESSVRSLSRRTSMNVMSAAFLRSPSWPPDLTEAILEDAQPAHLSLERLRGNIPADWIRQHSMTQ